MVDFIFRRKIAVLNSGEEAARVTEVLKNAGIKYSIKTTASRGPLGRSADVTAGKMIQFTAVNRSAYGTDITHVYTIYVNTKDYNTAKQLATEWQ